MRLAAKSGIAPVADVANSEHGQTFNESDAVSVSWAEDGVTLLVDRLF